MSDFNVSNTNFQKTDFKLEPNKEKNIVPLPNNYDFSDMDTDKNSHVILPNDPDAKPELKTLPNTIDFSKEDISLESLKEFKVEDSSIFE